MEYLMSKKFSLNIINIKAVYKTKNNIPAEARIYLDALAEAVETPIAYLSTGPDRTEGCVYPGTFLESLLG